MMRDEQPAGGGSTTLRASVGVGVIGAGMMGTNHVRTLTSAVDGAHVAAVADADPARAEAAAALGGGRAFADPYALIADDAVDRVVVASFDASHEEFVLACIAAGKPVLCEKPLATTAEACLRVIEAEVAAGRRLVSLGFMRRFDPAYEELKDRLGQVGEPLLIHCAHRNAQAPAIYTSEMLITSSCVHEIDISRWLLGEEIVAATVRAPRSTRQAPDSLVDPQLILLETAGGVLIDVEVFVNAKYGYDIRCELVGELGAVRLAEQVEPDFRARFATAYCRELDCWVQGTEGPSAWDGYAANAVADACLASLGGGGRVEVALTEKPALYG
jgi:myo-inositol 2-dehydrogenase/D-chiro-inositol 1-dehydrogenase